MEGMENIHIIYVIGLLLFIVLFLIILIRTIRRPAAEMNEIKESILLENDQDESKTS